MRQSKSLGSLALPVGNALKPKSTPRDTSEQYFPAAADAYELLEDCGRGVSATVWRARCLVNNEIVAVKIMDLEAQMAPLQDIIHEAQTMKAYKHEAILGLHVCFVHQTHLWMVMPYMEGGSVAHIMRYRYPDGLQEPVIATIMKEVLSALAYIHSHGDIHRDVKAGNILVDGEGHVKLGDFGVAASMERQDWGAPQGRNTFAGTPCWMAPEVLEQADRYGPKADIWSAGITMLELVHGHAPFSKLPPIKVLLLTLQGPPPQLEAECGGRHFSRGMREVVASCLNKDPAKRPTAKQLLSKGFFRQAKDAEYIKRTILAGLPPLPQRCMEIRMGKGRAATLAFENDRAAMASHISYITDVAQWDFNCTKSSAAMESGTANSWSALAEQATAAAAATAAATASSSSLADSSSGAAAGGGSSSSPSKAVSSRGDQQLDQPQLLQQQSIAGTGPGANGVASALGSSTSLDVPGQQHQQGVVGLEGFMSQQQQQQRQQQQVAGDVGPGARDVDTSSGGVHTGRAAADTADAAEKVPSPVRQPHSPRVVQAPAAVGAGSTAAGSPADASASARSKVLTCYSGGRTITTFPVSVPDTPDHSPMHSRPSTPEVQAAAGTADTGRSVRAAAVSYPGAAAAGASGAAIPGAKKHGRFTYVEGSTRYQGPELVSDSTKAAAAAAAGGAPGGSAVPGVKGYELLKQRSVSSPDMALLMSLQAAPRSSLSSSASAAGSSALSDTPVSPVSPVSPSSAFAPADAAAAAAAAAVGSGDDVSPGHLEQQVAPQWDLLSPTAVAAATVATAAAAAAGASSPRGRPSSPAAGSGTGLFAKLLPHKTGDAVSPRRPQSPVGSQQQHEHHEQHHLQHKLAGFFAHHGLGKGSKGASPLSSRDASPHVSRHSLLDPSSVSAGSSRPSSSGLAPAVAAGSGGAGAGGAVGSNAAAGMGSLSRSGAALQDIYHEHYSSRDASKSPRSHSPRAAAGHGRAAAGQKEHATAAQIWQHVKEACAETASDVAHIFRSRSGGSLHSERGSSHSPERPQQQQQHPPVSPPSPRLQLSQPHEAEAQQQQQQQAAALSAAAAAAHASKASNGTSSPTAATASSIATTPVAAAAAAAAAAFGAGPVVGRTGSSSNLVRLGSRGSIPAVSLAEMGSGGSSTSKPPRYQPAKAASTEQLVKQPLSPPRQPPQQQQPQLHVASEPQVALKPQQLLSQQQQEVQQELLQMQQQPGIPEDEVTEAAAAVTTLAAAADAVEQAAAAAAAAAAAGGVPGGVDAASVSPPAAGGNGSTSPQAATRSSRGMGVGVSDIQHPASTSPGAAVTEDDTRLAAAAVPGLSELGSRELSFAQQRSGPPQTCGSGDSSTAAAAAVAANRLSSHALDSPERKQGEIAAGPVQESSVTFPVMARLSGDSQTELAQQQQQQQPPSQASAVTEQGTAGTAHPTLLELRAVDSTEDDQQQVRGRALLTAADAAAGVGGRSLSAQQQQQHQQRVTTSAEPRSAHTSASPSRRHKGRFTIIET